MAYLPSLKQLTYLVALAKELNFTRAAQACFVGQSTLSAGLKELEDGLGIQLVDRDRQNVSITPAGLEVLERAKTILTASEDLVEYAGSSGKPMTATIRLGVIPTIAPFLLPTLLPLARETAVNYNEDVTAAILRDIASVKPVRAHMQAVLRLTAEANAWLVSGAQIAGFIRIEGEADADTALNPIWATYNLTEDGEPAQTEAGDFIQEEWA